MILRGDRVLLVERGREPLKGYWSLPGGVLEVGELAEDAVRREVREETGLDVKVETLVQVFERVMRDAEDRPEYHYVLLDYLCTPLGGELCAADDAARVLDAMRSHPEGANATIIGEVTDAHRGMVAARTPLGDRRQF